MSAQAGMPAELNQAFVVRLEEGQSPFAYICYYWLKAALTEGTPHENKYKNIRFDWSLELCDNGIVHSSGLRI